MSELSRGTQIAYVPTHAGGDLEHPDVEFGFVMNKPGHVGVFCRYWRKTHLGELRTVANSELTPLDCIVKHVSVSQQIVDDTIVRILEEAK